MKSFISQQFIKFLLVGGIGTISNLIIFFLFTDVLHYHYIPVAIGAFIVTASQNYILNHYWTFSEITKNKSANTVGLLKFISIAIIGLTINLITLEIIISVFNPKFKVIAQMFGIASGAVFNYFGSKLWIFKNEK